MVKLARDGRCPCPGPTPAWAKARAAGRRRRRGETGHLADAPCVCTRTQHGSAVGAGRSALSSRNDHRGSTIGDDTAIEEVKRVGDGARGDVLDAEATIHRVQVQLGQGTATAIGELLARRAELAWRRAAMA